MGVVAGMVVVDLCCGDGLFTAPLTRIASQVMRSTSIPTCSTAPGYAPASNCKFIVAEAMKVETVVPSPVDYVFLANTFHGVPDKEALARSVAALLKPQGRFGIVNWHRRPREETVVLGQPRGPKTEMRMEPGEVARTVEPTGLRLFRSVELPP